MIHARYQPREAERVMAAVHSPSGMCLNESVHGVGKFNPILWEEVASTFPLAFLLTSNSPSLPGLAHFFQETLYLRWVRQYW